MAFSAGDRPGSQHPVRRCRDRRAAAVPDRRSAGTAMRGRGRHLRPAGRGGPGLALRRYGAPVDIVVDVRDEFCPWNTGGFRLRGDLDGAECERTSAPADLTISARDLGAGYLGGTSVAQMVAAGLVHEHTPGSAHRAAAAFGWPVAPAIPDHF
ncbi:sterol carrier protein domain-containing protein [Mycolicibacterium sp. CBM1]